MAVPLLIHLYVNIFAGYGYFRDELYYIACTEHPGLGYVDQPPLSILILLINRNLFGDSIFALRLIPAIAASLTVFFTCLTASRLGGKTFSIILSSAAVIFAPVYLAMNSYYSMNSIDILLWSVSFYIVIRIIQEDRFPDWIYLGILIGLGLMNKIGFLWFEFGFFMGLILTRERKHFVTVKPYITLAISFLIFLPYVIWNFQNDFAHLEFIRNATSEKYSALNALGFIKNQFLIMNPASAVIWLAGLYYFLFNKEGRTYRMISIIYITAFIILVLNGHSKAEYLSPAYPALFAGGSVFIEMKTFEKFKWLRYAILIPVILIGVMIAPIVMPVLKVENNIAYSKMIGMAPSSSENKQLSELSQFFADMHGWEELASDVSKVYISLPEEDRKRAVVFGWNYGDASAVNFFRNKYPLPEAISSHNSYWLWGYGDRKDPVMIIIGGEKEDYTDEFDSVEVAGIHSARYSMPYENNMKIFVVKGFKNPISGIWNRIKHYE